VEVAEPRGAIAEAVPKHRSPAASPGHRRGWARHRGTARPGRRRELIGLAVVVAIAVVALANLMPATAPSPGAAPRPVMPTTTSPDVVVPSAAAPASMAGNPPATGRPSAGTAGGGGRYPVGDALPGATSAPARPVDAWYEAEAAQLSGQAEVLGWTGASGGKIVDKLGTEQVNSPYGPYQRSGSISFTSVTVPAPGRYQMTVFYVSGEPRNAYVRVNGGTARVLSFPGSSWSVIYSATFGVDLMTGTNSITFSNPTYWVPRLDRIRLYQ
jgi:hypothetical protein